MTDSGLELRPHNHEKEQFVHKRTLTKLPVSRRLGRVSFAHGVYSADSQTPWNSHGFKKYLSLLIYAAGIEKKNLSLSILIYKMRAEVPNFIGSLSEIM